MTTRKKCPAGNKECPPWTTERYLDMREELLTKGSEKNRAFFIKLVPGSEHVIGLYTQQAKDVVKEILAGDFLSYIEVAKPLYHEEIGLLGAVMAESKQPKEQMIEYIKRYLPYNTTWATNDSFAASMKCISKDLAFYFPFIEKLAKSKEPYNVRMGIILLMNYYLCDEYIDRVLAISDNAKLDHYYVKMGNAWLIATALAKQYEKTKKFLRTTKLDNWTVNKGIQKACESRRISDEQKAHLRTLKRK